MPAGNPGKENEVYVLATKKMTIRKEINKQYPLNMANSNYWLFRKPHHSIILILDPKIICKF